MEIKLLESTNLVDDIWQFNFTRPQALKFDAGDYVELSVGGDKRWLTIASAPTDDKLQFITKISDKRSGFKQALSDLKPSQTAKISPAIGNFNLPPTDKQSLLWAAGGIGITPFISMTRWLQANPKRNPRIYLVYAAKPNQHIFLDNVSAVATKVKELSARPTLDDFSPLLTPETLIYLSGPQPLCEQLNQQLLDSGVERSRIKLDYFPGYDSL